MKTALSDPSPNFDDRGGNPVDILLLHYTGMPTSADARDRLVDPAARVSAHYFVETDGTIRHMVAETHRAWHAGQAFWDGATDINARSIGIEIVNPGHEFGYAPFPGVQIDAVIDLCRDIVTRHPIPGHRILGHSDVAPLRKTDPGEKFPWKRLAAAGVGLWPEEGAFDDHADPVDLERELVAQLRAYGYGYLDGEGDIPAVLTAFQRHFLPSAIGTPQDGTASAEAVRRLCALNRMKSAPS